MQVDKSVRGAVEAEALNVCKLMNIKPDGFNQDACAVTTIRSLAKVKTDAEKLQVAYVCSNASALRQAISAEKKQKAVEISAQLISLTKSA